MGKTKKLIILSGPSCAGKGPLMAALKRHHKEINFAKLVLCHSRKPRWDPKIQQYEAHGVEYYFLPKSLFYQLDPQHFVVGQTRSDLQAIDMTQVRELLEAYDVVIAEIYPTLGLELIKWADQQTELNFEISTVFLRPLSEEEIAHQTERQNIPAETLLYNTMKAKLLRRGMDPPDKVEERAGMAWSEIQMAKPYAYQIVNHAGEDAVQEWTDPLGPEAARVLQEFVSIITA